MSEVLCNDSFHKQLIALIDGYVDRVYEITKSFPKSEQFSLVSQFRRASLSVALNYIEGSSRFRKTVYKNFIEIAFGSLKESLYLVGFSYRHGYIDIAMRDQLQKTGDRIGAMFLGIHKRLVIEDKHG